MTLEWVSFCLSQLAGAIEADASEFIRLGVAPPFGVWSVGLRWTARLVRLGKSIYLPHLEAPSSTLVDWGET